MWQAENNRIRHSVWWWNQFHFSYLVPDFSVFVWEMVTLPLAHNEHTGYDAWVQQYNRADEIELISGILDSLAENPRRVHIAGISCVESIELLAEYYREQWYHNSSTNQYFLPPDTLLTVSVTMRHILWCEKDKIFLSKKDASGNPNYALVPPLRTPSDLRSLQQAARSGLITALSVSHLDELYFSQVLSRQILTPFQFSQLVYYRWKQFWFWGYEHEFSLSLPDFSEDL